MWKVSKLVAVSICAAISNNIPRNTDSDIFLVESGYLIVYPDIGFMEKGLPMAIYPSWP